MRDIVWAGPCDMSGYGVACLGYAIGLTKAGLHLKLIDKSQSQNLVGRGMSPAVISQIEQLKQVQVSKRSVLVQHQVPDKLEEVQAWKKVGYTIFEMTTIPKSWLLPCMRMDQIWTGSEYSRQAFLASGIPESKIFVVPHIIDTDLFAPTNRPIKLPNRAGYNFVSVFDFHTRKAWRELLTAYIAAFRAKDDVCLWLKCYRHGFHKENQIALVAELYKFLSELRTTDVPRIELCPFDLPTTIMPHFYPAFDCYVSISREGFGLPYAEAAACGLTIIGPEKSGTREFLTEQNSFVVKHTIDSPINEEMLRISPSFHGLKWANHSVDDLTEKMRYVVQHPTEAKTRGLKVRQTVQERLHFSPVGEKVRTCLELL
jgi:glycosyltransferase involved in cell wall biosynthesis